MCTHSSINKSIQTEKQCANDKWQARLHDAYILERALTQTQTIRSFPVLWVFLNKSVLINQGTKGEFSLPLNSARHCHSIFLELIF